MNPNQEPRERKLSEIFIEALRAKNTTPEKLSAQTGISERFIQLLINDEVKKLPAAPYLHGYIIKISDTLNLDGEALWKTYFKHNESVSRSGKKDHLPANRFLVKEFDKRWLIGAAIVLLLIVYAAIRLPAILGKPLLTIDVPPEDTTTKTALFTVKGKIDPQDQLTINNEVVYPQEDGSFEKVLHLEAGFNTIQFTAKKVLGQTTTLSRQIFLETKNASSTTLTPFN